MQPNCDDDDYNQEKMADKGEKKKKSKLARFLGRMKAGKKSETPVGKDDADKEVPSLFL